MTQITISLESPAFMDASEIINIPCTVEITADIELPEIWGFRGNTIGYGRPYVLGVEFSCILNIGSMEANRAMEKHLLGQYEIDQDFQERINKLIEATARDPYVGIGKPEPLKHALSGFWSRRIDDEHRMVYRVNGDQLEIAQLRFHY